jgi:hypothetical protein
MQNGKELWISQIYFPKENPVDWVHGVWTGWRGSSPSWIDKAQTGGHNGAMPAWGARSRGLVGAR